MTHCEWQPPRRRRLLKESAILRAAATDVDAWNAAHAIGADVCVHRDNGEKLLTKTRSVASVLCGSAVVWVDGIAGAYAVDRVHAIAPTPEAGRG